MHVCFHPDKGLSFRSVRHKCNNYSIINCQIIMIWKHMDNNHTPWADGLKLNVCWVLPGNASYLRHFNHPIMALCTIRALVRGFLTIDRKSLHYILATREFWYIKTQFSADLFQVHKNTKKNSKDKSVRDSSPGHDGMQQITFNFHAKFTNLISKTCTGKSI